MAALFQKPSGFRTDQDGTIQTARLEAVSFADDPSVSFGDVQGSGIPGNAGYDMRSILQDGFESGDLSNWSSTMP